MSEILDRQSLDKAVSGTQFCTRMASTWNSELEYPDLEPADRVSLKMDPMSVYIKEQEGGCGGASSRIFKLWKLRAFTMGIRSMYVTDKV